MKQILSGALAALVLAAIAAGQNQCLELDGFDDALVVPAAAGLDGVTQCTFEAWVRSDAPNAGDKVLDMGTLAHRWEMSAGTGQTESTAAGGSASPAVGLAPWNDGHWHHWCYADDGVTARFYFDGTLLDEVASLGITWNMNGLPIFIGKRIVGDDFWTGAIDELRIWNVARTGSEIRAGMLGPLDAAPGLVSAWHFEGDALDATGTNDAVFLGAPAFAACDPLASPYPGSGDDLELRTGIDAIPAAAPAFRTAFGGDTLLIDLDSPLASLELRVPFLVADVIPWGTPSETTTLFPEFWLDLSETLVLFDGGNGPLGPTLLPPGGLSFALEVPALLAGQSVLLQGGVLGASTATGNPFFVLTDGHEIQVH